MPPADLEPTIPAVDLGLKPRGHWERHMLIITHINHKFLFAFSAT